ncbi:glycine betaine ABC transporter substrate-binding protein [Candidiatus Paracoxiella cheracis]|uniref:glycine betaine ABC transporter substrate-binding protein n=1 Tax=Candidiatus Paracoxiella cheracis TaxID=3405120 RepID=UPI003BF4F1CA
MSHPKLRSPILGITSIFQTIPSLALLAFLVPFLGIGIKPTIVTLTVYALLPIVRNTFTGLNAVPPESIEAARGLGFTRWQRMAMVEIPLAMPVIVAGIRTATAMTVGITTIAAFIGAGGLGVFITQGLSLDNSGLILLGAIPAALLALALDFIIANIETSLSHRQRQALKFKKTRLTIIIVIILIILYLAARFAIAPLFNHRKDTIIIGSKNFTEQYILSDMMADLITAKTNLNVKLKLNVGATAILQAALLKGNVDLYPEYTGTAYLTVLKYKKLLGAAKTYQIVKQQYQKRYNLIWLKPFGFSNSETLAVRQDFATRRGLTNLTQLAQISLQLTIAAPAEFLKRPDGFPGLKKAYGFNFKKILLLEPNLMYQAIKNNDVQVIEVFTTDGRIVAYHLFPLKDNKHFYPPYAAAPVIRDATLKAHPEVASALAPMTGLINQKTMQHLNYLVDVKKLSPARVAHDFLIQKGFIK